MTITLMKEKLGADREPYVVLGAAVDPLIMVAVPEREDLRPVADEAGRRIRAALDTLLGGER